MLLLLLSVCDTVEARKPPDVQVLRSNAHRTEGQISIDGRVRIGREKPIRGLVLLFDFMEPDGQVITTQEYELDEDEVLGKGAEPDFHVRLRDEPRAVHYEIRASDGHNRELRMGNSGPFVID
ncbi:MAG: hypothetical protein M1436_00735 [Acidobacteria bacterium]|nr:hypothetical protein [Acidobacteriota bacterium]